MATRNQPAIDQVEYWRIEDAVEQFLALGYGEIEAAAIAAEADVDVATVFPAMRRLAQLHDYISEDGVGRWTIDREE